MKGTHARLRISVTISAIGLILAATPALATTGSAIDHADTTWILISTALVLMMTIPGLALFYGGMVRRKNVLSTLMHSLVMCGLVTVQWVLFGYSLAFGPDHFGLIGGLDWIGLRGVSASASSAYAATVPHQAFMAFQCMFAIITPALITGAFAERITFRGFLLFSLLWTTLIYDPLAHWVWGTGGWLRSLGALDFAGGTVVHIASGVSALAAAFALGRRIGYPHTPTLPHNLTMTITGAGLLWVGWFGFNAGSALAADGIAVTAFVTTHVACAAAMLSWTVIEWGLRGRPTVLGAASGAVAGLVAITPAAGYVGVVSALVIGAVAGVVCFYAVTLKMRLGYDDTLDVVGVHGVGGTWGALATGLFASTAVNPGGANGLFTGNPTQLLIQLVGVGATLVFAFVGSTVILRLVDFAVGLRVAEEDERMGLDLSEHNESAYALEV